MVAVIDAEHQRLQRKCARLEQQLKPGEGAPRKCVEEGFAPGAAEGDAGATTTTPATTTTTPQRDADEQTNADPATTNGAEDEVPATPAPPAPVAPPPPPTPVAAPPAVPPTVSPEGESGGAAPQP